MALDLTLLLGVVIGVVLILFIERIFGKNKKKDVILQDLAKDVLELQIEMEDIKKNLKK